MQCRQQGWALCQARRLKWQGVWWIGQVWDGLSLSLLLVFRMIVLYLCLIDTSIFDLYVLAAALVRGVFSKRLLRHFRDHYWAVKVCCLSPWRMIFLFWDFMVKVANEWTQFVFDILLQNFHDIPSSRFCSSLPQSLNGPLLPKTDRKVNAPTFSAWQVTLLEISGALMKNGLFGVKEAGRSKQPIGSVWYVESHLMTTFLKGLGKTTILRLKGS